jgi:hypothetical protein
MGVGQPEWMAEHQLPKKSEQAKCGVVSTPASLNKEQLQALADMCWCPTCLCHIANMIVWVRSCEQTLFAELISMQVTLLFGTLLLCLLGAVSRHSSGRRRC